MITMLLAVLSSQVDFFVGPNIIAPPNFVLQNLVLLITLLDRQDRGYGFAQFWTIYTCLNMAAHQRPWKTTMLPYD